MSATSGQDESNGVHDSSLATEAPTGPESEPDQGDGRILEDYDGASDAADETRLRKGTANTPDGPIKLGAADGGLHSTESTEKIHGDGLRSPMADGIEKEASEHLARRAAEMSLNQNDGMEEDHNILTAEKKDNQLPATPPAPPVPAKDEPANIQTEPKFDQGDPPKPEPATNDVLEAPQGTAEATGAEIQNILDQFQAGTQGLGSDEIMSPIIERQQPLFVLPPRTSSLEHRDQHGLTPQTTGGSVSSKAFGPEASHRPQSVSEASLNQVKSDDTESIASGRASIFQPPPPEPDPEPPLPFDFHRFLEQLRHRTADPVAKFLRSFLNEFGKKQWMVHEQVKIISDFLEFISKKMSQCEVWRTVSDAEFDNAREGMEKLVMNRLYSQTFSPAIPQMVGSPRKTGGKGGRSAADMANPHGPGRRGQHQEDVERDEVIAQKMRIYGWIQEEHLDIKPINDKGRNFLMMAQKELLKINTYRAPRDKVICVLNCCKVIFGFLRNSKGDQSADAFVPLLIYTVLRARPEHLVSNVQYIWRFRNQDKLGGEAGYYMSSLMGVVTFVENLDRTTITITDEEFEQKVEQAVSAIAEENKAEEYEKSTHAASAIAPPLQQRLTEKSALSRPEVTPKNSMDAERSSPRRNVTREKTQHAHQSSTDTIDDLDAVTGLLRTIQKPLSSIGRIFTDDGSNEKQQSQSLRPASTPLPGATQRNLTPALSGRQRSADGRGQERPGAERQITAADAAARQDSAETAQVQRARAQEYKVVVETLQSMFPNLDKEVIEDVVRAQEGNVSRAVDLCLGLSG